MSSAISGPISRSTEGSSQSTTIERVRLFLFDHPDAKTREVAQALGISITTANRWRQRVRDKDEQQEAE